MSTILELHDVTCALQKGTNVFHDVDLQVNDGDIVMLQGRSGSGKSTLLKCVAHLIDHSGEVLYRGRTRQSYGIPAYRTRVLYIPQRPSLLPGTPMDFLGNVTSFNAHKLLWRNRYEDPTEETQERAFEVGEEWGVSSDKWSQPWTSLSGGEAQRVLLATALALDHADVLLLDEPTSALDLETSLLVEKYLTERVQDMDANLKALIWITHSEEQGKRVGTRFIQLKDGTSVETEEYASLESCSSSPDSQD